METTFFRSDFSVVEMFEALRGAVPQWRWFERDNDRWGDYISAAVLPDPHWGGVKIFFEDMRYALELHLRSDAASEDEMRRLAEPVAAEIASKVLPAIQAVDVELLTFPDS